MCHTTSLNHTCAHTRTLRRSTCRGTFTVQPKRSKPPRPACCGASTLVMRIEGECGDCLRTKAEEELLAARAEHGLDGQTDVDLGQESYKLSRMFPTVKRYQGLSRSVGGVEGRAKTMRGSLLRREVLAEEVVEKYEVHKTLTGARWDQEEWGDDYKTLDEELAERGEEGMAVSLDLPMTSSMNESMDEYLSAFPKDDAVGVEAAGQEDDTSSWSSAWDSGLEGCSVWATEETNEWPPKEGAAASMQQEREANESQLSFENVTSEGANKTENARSDRQVCGPSTTISLPFLACSAPSPSTSPSPSSPGLENLKPPTSRGRSSASSSSSGKAKQDNELRDRLRCLLLRVPYLVYVGEG